MTELREARSNQDMRDWYRQLAINHPEMVPADVLPARPRNARGHWQPILARVYGIRPWEMGQLTLGEVRAIVADIEQFAEAYG